MLRFMFFILNIGSKLGRNQIESYYRSGAYTNAKTLARQHKDVEGVNALSEQLDYDYQDYCSIMNQRLRGKELLENILYKMWFVSHKAKQIAFWTVVIGLSIILTDKFTGIQLANLFSRYVGFFKMILAFSARTVIYSKIAEVIMAGVYSAFSAILEKKVATINEDYLRRVKQIERAIDDLYLDSLDPMHRELVLLRRGQTEMMENQNEYHQEQLQLSSESLREQQTIRDMLHNFGVELDKIYRAG